MTKNLKNLTKMLLIPTLVIGGLSACGYNNNGARTHNYDGARTHNYDGARPYSYGGTSTYNNNGAMGPYHNRGMGTYNYGGEVPFNDDISRSYNHGNGTAPHYGYNYDGARPYNNYGTGTGTYNYNGGTYSHDGTGNFNHNTSKRVARTAADISKGVHNVTRATAVAHGKDIVIGIDVKKGANVKEVENNVRQKVQAKEPGYKVHVTSDSKIHTRIQTIYTTMNTNMNNNMRNNPGHPVRALGTDMSNVIRDIGRTVTAPFR